MLVLLLLLNTFFLETFTGTFSCRHNKLKEVLYTIINWFISVWGTPSSYFFLQNFTGVKVSVYFGRKSLTDHFFTGDWRLLAGALFYSFFWRKFIFLVILVPWRSATNWTLRAPPENLQRNLTASKRPLPPKQRHHPKTTQKRNQTGN